MKSRRLCVVLALAIGCNGAEIGQEQLPVISDGSHTGRVGFYFLPPIVADPNATGTFDPSFAPHVEIRDMTANTTVTAYEAAAITVDPIAEHYAVNWDTKSPELDPTHTYRIAVMLYKAVIGFADVDVVGSGSELKNVVTNEYIPLLDGRTLPIKFRLERGVIDDLTPKVTISLAPFVNGLTAGAGAASFATTGSFSNVSFSCIMNGAEVPCVAGSPLAWSQLPDGSTLDIRITATANETGITGPTAIATATVDAVAPIIFTIAFSPSLGDTIGPLAMMVFTSSDTPTTATFTCRVGYAEFPCVPGVEFAVAQPDGTLGLVIAAVDQVGNVNQVIQLLNVDAQGPVFNPSRTFVPTSSTCPASNASTEIRFGASDPSRPVIYKCSLDGDPMRICSEVAAEEGAFRWTDLAHGAHTLVVLAYDFFQNQSMEGLVVDFSVDRLPPSIAIDVDAITAASGSVLVSLAEQDTAWFGFEGHLPMLLTNCTVSGSDQTSRTCDCTEVSSDGFGRSWQCLFSDLPPGPATVRITAEDSCGPVNSASGEQSWLVQ